MIASMSASAGWPHVGTTTNAVADVVVEVRHGDALAVDLDERQHRDLDHLERPPGGVERTRGAATR